MLVSDASTSMSTVPLKASSEKGRGNAGETAPREISSGAWIFSAKPWHSASSDLTQTMGCSRLRQGKNNQGNQGRLLGLLELLLGHNPDSVVLSLSGDKGCVLQAPCLQDKPVFW